MSKRSKRTEYVSNTLPKPLLKLAKKSDFCMWTDESWKPEGASIDWSCQYDKEMKLYSEMLIQKCFKKARQALQDELEFSSIPGSQANYLVLSLLDAERDMLEGFEQVEQKGDTDV